MLIIYSLNLTLNIYMYFFFRLDLFKIIRSIFV